MSVPFRFVLRVLRAPTRVLKLSTNTIAHEPAKFTQGSILRHVVVMTATGWIGLVSIFVVDFLNLFYISRLGQQELAAAIGYSGAILFFLISISIGCTIATTARAARLLGAGRREDARRLGGSAVALSALTLGVPSFALMPVLPNVLGLIGATGVTRDIATHFLLIVLPGMPLVGMAMAFSGLLRAVGDAKRSMEVTLIGGLVTALLDPIFIFVFDLGITGAAIVTVISRFALFAVGWWGAVKVHDLVARPSLSGIRGDLPALAGIAVPAILTNVATPVGSAFATSTVARFGDAAVAGWAVTDRLAPLAFGAIFALSGSVGAILGQNLGARRFDRLKQVVTASLILTICYVAVMWAVLALSSDLVVAIFNLKDEGAALVRFFCHWAAGAFFFFGALFVANATFNNLGFPVLSTAFNWGRATIGVIPFVWIGAHYAGVIGAVAGWALGLVPFGLAAIIVAYRVIARMERNAAQQTPPAPMLTTPVPPAQVPASQTVVSDHHI